MKKLQKISTSIIFLLLFLTSNSQKVLGLDLDADRISNTAGMTFNNATSTIQTNANANQINKIEWSQFNIPSGQNVFYDFQASGQTVINYIAPGAPPSKIFGSITMGSTAGTINNGNLMLINPNGITFSGGQVINLASLDIGGFTASTHDIVNFSTINPTDTTFDLVTYTPPQGGANGLLVTNGSQIGTSANPLRCVNLFANGLTVTGNSQINATDSTDSALIYDNRVECSTGGDANVFLDPTAADPLLIARGVNTKQACTGNKDTSIRYYDYASFDSAPTVKGSKGQLNICSSTINIGPGSSATNSKGVFILSNFSNVPSGSFARLVNANITVTGAIATTDDQIILVSEKSVGAGDNPIYVNSSQTFNILSDGLGPITVTQSTDSVPTPPQPQPDGTTTPIKFVATQGVTPTSNINTRPVGIWQTDSYNNCLDCFPDTVLPATSNSNDTAAVAIPLGVIGAGLIGALAFPPPTGFAAPIAESSAQSIVRTCPDIAAMPVYDKDGKIKYLKIISK